MAGMPSTQGLRCRLQQLGEEQLLEGQEGKSSWWNIRFRADGESVAAGKFPARSISLLCHSGPKLIKLTHL